MELSLQLLDKYFSLYSFLCYPILKFAFLTQKKKKSIGIDRIEIERFEFPASIRRREFQTESFRLIFFSYYFSNDGLILLSLHFELYKLIGNRSWKRILDKILIIRYRLFLCILQNIRFWTTCFEKFFDIIISFLSFLL